MTAKREVEVGGDRGDRAGVQNRVRRLHHRPDAGAIWRAGFAQGAGGGHDRPRAVDLGQQNGVRPGAGGSDEILLSPRRMRPIDPDDDLTAAEGACSHGLGDLLARGRFLIGGD